MILDDVAAIGDSDAPLLRASIPNIPLLTGTPEQVAASIDTILQTAAHVALTRVGDALAVVAPRDSGDLVSSFRADPAGTTGGIELTGHSFAEEGIVGRIFSNLPQAVVFENGRLPGSYVNAAGIASLEAWASRKLGLEGAAATRAAFAIATLIHQRGLPGRHYLEAALPLASADIDTIFANAGEAIAALLAGGTA